MYGASQKLNEIMRIYFRDIGIVFKKIYFVAKNALEKFNTTNCSGGELSGLSKQQQQQQQ